MKNLTFCISLLVLLSSCVSSKKFKQSQNDLGVLNNKYAQLEQDLKNCEGDLLKASSFLQTTDAQNQNLKEQLKTQQESSSAIMNRLAEMNVLSGKQAENINKSLDKIAEKDALITNLRSEVSRKDSLNLALVMNLKGSLGNYDKDIDIIVEKGVVYISISDKLLFKTGSFDVHPNALAVLEKVATVLNNQPNIEFLVEGHTDNVPIKGGALKDNWDLSVLRATAVVRILENKFGIDPKRMTAGGRSAFSPIADNTTQEGRATNRRTRIVVLPQLDQFFQLMEPNRVADQPGK